MKPSPKPDLTPYLSEFTTIANNVFLSNQKGVPRRRLLERDCCGVWARFALWDPSFPPLQPWIDPPPTPHAPSPGHVNPGCRPRDPRRLAMEYQSTWFQAWWLWVWPRFELLTPSPWFLIRRRPSSLTLSHSLCQFLVWTFQLSAIKVPHKNFNVVEPKKCHFDQFVKL